MNQVKLEVVKQEMARVNVDILGDKLDLGKLKKNIKSISDYSFHI